MKKILFAFGTSKINYKIVSGIDRNIIVIVFSTKKFSHSKIISLCFSDIDGIYDSKKAKIVSDTTKVDRNLSFVEDGINIYIMNVYSHACLFESLGYFHAMSCCRDGLTRTYIPLLNKLKCKGKIISFDNNKNIAQQAQELSVNCRIFAGVAHCYVPFVINESLHDNTTTITAERFGYLYFPPDCDSFNQFFRVRLSSPLSVLFAETKEEFIEAVNRKLLNINVIHTLTCFEIKLLNPTKYDTLTFGSISKADYNKIIKRVLAIHKKMYLALFGEDEEYTMALACAAQFIDNLWTYNETCTRGVDFNSSCSLEKAKRHLDFVNETGVNTEKYSSLIQNT